VPSQSQSRSQSSGKRIVFRPITGLLILVAIAFVAIAVVYFTTAAGSLPAFFPGHLAHSAHKHTKHGLAFLGLAAVALVGAWFTTAERTA
jgi:urea transporter